MIIETNLGLASFCEEISAAPALFLDTEFVSEGRYYPEVGTIQIAAGEHAALIDPLAVSDLAPLATLLFDPKITKVFHAANHDLSIFHRIFGRALAPVFDTQLAAALVGYEWQISFGQLVERVTRVRLKKSHSFTDWLRRPLSAKQVEYALEDVDFLAPIYERLTTELRARGRWEWAREEFSILEDPARFTPADPRELVMKVRGWERLNSPELAALSRLVIWREATARETNLPVGQVCMDIVLLELARRPRKTVDQLNEIRGIRSQQIKRFGGALIELLADCTGAVCDIEPAKATPLSAALEPTVDFLNLCLKALAAENNLASSILASRSDLSAIVLEGSEAHVPLMRGWRREVVGNTILEALQGHATVRIVPGNRQVHLKWHQHPVE